MAKAITTHKDQALTIAERIDVIRLERDDAALSARAEFDTRLVRAITARAHEVLDMITG